MSYIYNYGIIVYKGIWIMSYIYNYGIIVYKGIWIMSYIYNYGIIVYKGIWIMSYIYRIYRYLDHFVHLLWTVMVSLHASSAVDRGFELRSGQTKDYIGMCCFSATMQKEQRLVDSESG